MGLREVGLDFQGLLIMCQALLELASAGQEETQVVVGHRKSGWILRAC